MPLLPFQRLEIHSPLPADEAVARLAEQVEPHRWFRFGRAASPFEGEVNGSEFRIQRIIRYRNSFLPRIRGTISPTATGSRIDCTLALHPLAMAFMVLWFGVVIAIGFGFLFLPDAPEGVWPKFIPLFMILFGWLLATAPFTWEANRARDMLAELFAVENPVRI